MTTSNIGKILEYPFDPFELIRKKRSIKRQLLDSNYEYEEIKIAILSGSTVAEIKELLELFLLKEKIRPIFYESDYNKYFETIVFGDKKLIEFSPDLIYIHTSQINIRFNSSNNTEIGFSEQLHNEFSRFEAIWKTIKDQFNCDVIQNNFEMPDYRTLGNYDSYSFLGRTHFILEINRMISEFAKNNKWFHINDINYLASWLGLRKWSDRSFWYSYKYCLSAEAIPYLSFNISNIIKAIYGKSKKCLVLDLDNTLWGGVIGDCGPEKIKVGKETAISEAYSSFQEYLLELKNRGIVLTICSKNELENAEKGLKHPDSILSPDDFVSMQVNWSNKDENIIKISKNVNLGIDSFVFVDDNPAERELVQSSLPQVAVPNIGSDITKFIDIIDKSGFFETIRISSDDINRNKEYENNKKRKNLQESFQSYDEFLLSLQMEAEIKYFTPIYLDRITQLINKTNQFNLTTRRYNLSEIDAIFNNQNYLSIYGKLIDKFGDNGVVSVIIAERQEQTLIINLWIMSCRVFKRDMEYAMFDYVVHDCMQNKINKIKGIYLETNKNSYVKDLYSSLGFTKITDSEWLFNIPEKYDPKNKYIRVNNE